MSRTIAADETGKELLRSAQQALSRRDYLQVRASCEEFIRHNPNDARAHALLGISYLQQDQFDRAGKHLKRALKLFPADIGSLIALGQVYLRQGEASQAENCFKEATQFASDDVEIMRLHALSIMQQGRFAAALEILDHLLMTAPTDADAFNKRGFAKQRTGDLVGAVGNYSRAILIQPRLVEAWNNRGYALGLQGRFEPALADFDRAISLRPGHALAHANKATTLLAMNRPHAAREPAEKSVELAPQNSQFHTALGMILQKSGDYPESILRFDAALKITPKLPDALLGKAYSLQQLGQFRESARLYERVLELNPGTPEALWKQGELMLLEANLPEGWKKYESRLQTRSFRQASRLRGVSEWRGEDLAGKSLCVHGEIDPGDTIQFCRYLPRLADQAARVIFRIPESLRKILDCVDPRILLVDRNMPLQNIDYQCSLASLPERFGTTLKTIPRFDLQLPASEEDLGRWQGHLKHRELNVGICGLSDPAGERDFTQSIAAEYLEPLRKIPGINLLSLDFPKDVQPSMNDAAATRIEQNGPEEPDIQNHFDCAVLMKGLDLIITVDDVVAHLAGALGIPVLVLLKFVPNWRWMLDREDSPWYPAMRLFRQTNNGDWTDVVNQIDAELRRAQNGKNLV